MTQTPPETRQISGEIEGWGNNIREFSNKQRGSRGIKIEGNWHNIVDIIVNLKQLDTLFPKGSFVTFTEKQNTRGFWDVVGDIKLVDKKEVYKENCKEEVLTTTIPESTSKRAHPGTEKNIILQVCFKGAIEITKEIMNQTANAIDFDIETCVGNLTENLYIKLQEVKNKLITEKWW